MTFGVAPRPFDSDPTGDPAALRFLRAIGVPEAVDRWFGQERPTTRLAPDAGRDAEVQAHRRGAAWLAPLRDHPLDDVDVAPTVDRISANAVAYTLWYAEDPERHCPGLVALQLLARQLAPGDPVRAANAVNRTWERVLGDLTASVPRAQQGKVEPDFRAERGAMRAKVARWHAGQLRARLRGRWRDVDEAAMDRTPPVERQDAVVGEAVPPGPPTGMSLAARFAYRWFLHDRAAAGGAVALRRWSDAVHHFLLRRGLRSNLEGLRNDPIEARLQLVLRAEFALGMGDTLYDAVADWPGFGPEDTLERGLPPERARELLALLHQTAGPIAERLGPPGVLLARILFEALTARTRLAAFPGQIASERQAAARQLASRLGALVARALRGEGDPPPDSEALRRMRRFLEGVDSDSPWRGEAALPPSAVIDGLVGAGGPGPGAWRVDGVRPRRPRRRRRR